MPAMGYSGSMKPPLDSSNCWRGDMIPAGRNLVAVPVERKSNLGPEESVDG